MSDSKYVDEAGYLLEGGEWILFEKPDHSSSVELLNAFLRDYVKT